MSELRIENILMWMHRWVVDLKNKRNQICTIIDTMSDNAVVIVYLLCCY